MPAAFASWGKRLVAVIPGSVFISRQKISPFSSSKKSAREYTSNFKALNAPTYTDATHYDFYSNYQYRPYKKRYYAINSFTFNPYKTLDYLNENYSEVLFKKYNIEFVDSNDYLEKFAISKGHLLKNNETDTQRSASLILNDLKNGRIGRITIEKWEDK